MGPQTVVYLMCQLLKAVNFSQQKTWKSQESKQCTIRRKFTAANWDEGDAGEIIIKKTTDSLQSDRNRWLKTAIIVLELNISLTLLNARLNCTGCSSAQLILTDVLHNTESPALRGKATVKVAIIFSVFKANCVPISWHNSNICGACANSWNLQLPQQENQHP